MAHRRLTPNTNRSINYAGIGGVGLRRAGHVIAVQATFRVIARQLDSAYARLGVKWSQVRDLSARHCQPDAVQRVLSGPFGPQIGRRVPMKYRNELPTATNQQTLGSVESEQQCPLDVQLDTVYDTRFAFAHSAAGCAPMREVEAVHGSGTPLTVPSASESGAPICRNPRDRRRGG